MSHFPEKRLTLTKLGEMLPKGNYRTLHYLKATLSAKVFSSPPMANIVLSAISKGERRLRQ